MSLARRLLRRDRPAPAERRWGIEDWIGMAAGQWPRMPIEQTLADGTRRVQAPGDFMGHASRYAGNGVIHALIAWRLDTFAAGRFTWRSLRDGRLSEYFGTPALDLLDRPWPGGTTQDLLARMLLDVDLAGNSYWTRGSPADVGVGGGRDELVRLRPDWVDVIMERRPGGLGWRKLGYLYRQDGEYQADAIVPLTLRDVAHFASLPDPVAEWRGMSWLTPLIRETSTDETVGDHEARYFENAATPNMVISYPASMGSTQVKEYSAVFDEINSGPRNAGRTAHIGGGADLTVAGSNLRDSEARLVRTHGETRMAAAAKVPPILAGLSEGLQSATYSNYGQARKRYVDGTLAPLWSNVAGSLQVLLPPPRPGARLAVDTRDVALTREDARDEAEIRETQARTMRTLIDGGYTPESVAAAVASGDYGLLQHTGLYSVQLQRPGQDSGPDGRSETGDDDE